MRGVHAIAALAVTSVPRYLDLANELLVFVLRAAKGQHKKKFSLSEQQKKLALDVYEMLKEENRTVGAEEVVNSVEEQAQWIKKIQQLMLALFQHERACLQDSRWFSPVVSYAALSSVTLTGDWLRASGITQMFAQIAYVARGAFVAHIRDQEKKNIQAYT